MASSAADSSAIVQVPTAEQLESRNAQIRATLYGQCIGDAIGLMTEFMTKEEAKENYKEKNLEYAMKATDFHRTGWEIGDWTDDSDQMLLILLSLMDHAGQVNVQDFAGRMKNWMKSGFPELGDYVGHGIGRITNSVLRRLNFPTDPQAAAHDVWKAGGGNIAPNGGVMRTSVVGTHCWWDLDRVGKTALEFCRCTHHDPRCQASVVAVSVCISLMLQRQPRHLTRWGHYDVDALIKDSYQHAAQCLQTEEEREVLWQHMSFKKVKELQLAEAGRIGYTYKSMGSGFWALKKDNFRKAIQKITMEGGDADTNACVAGALLGCKLGLDKIPSTWKAELKHKDWLDGNIDRWLAFQKEMAAPKPAPEADKDPSSEQQ